jgi:restriction system protein
MARRGFFAELQRQARVAARESERQQRATVREHDAAIRRAEQARKAEEKARAQTARAAQSEWKRLEKEAKAAHVAAREAEVEELNSRIAAIYDEIDSLLAATLDVDDYVDLDKLRRTVQHPPFDRGDLESPIPPPDPISDPLEPVFEPPEPPKGLFASKKKHAKAVAAAEADHLRAHAKWQAKVIWVSTRRKDAADEHARAEQDRIAALEQERARYQAECAAREAEVGEHNAKMDAFITNLGYGTVDAVQEYVSIVLSSSVYPEQFPIDHDFTFDPSTAELKMRVLVPPPSEVPDIKAYKYTKSTDEITKTALSQKACKDRYSGAVQQVALRSLHEIFEADRRGLINTISLEVGTETTSPATGKNTYLPFIAVAAERDTFVDFDLSSVVPAATLDHLGAAVSKDPYGLIAADTTGVRRS